MILKEIKETWTAELREMQISLVQLEDQNKYLQKQIKQHELGQQLAQNRTKRRELKKMIEQKRSETAGLQKALMLAEKGSVQTQIKQNKVIAMA